MSVNPYQQQLDHIEQELAQNKALLEDPELKNLAQEEIIRLENQKEQLEQAARDYLTAVESSDEENSVEHINCIIELRPGAGGDEAKIWAHDLLRMYVRFADTLNLKIEHIDDLVVKFKGKTNQLGDGVLTAYQVFQYESGVHRVQRVPETESQGRIHTSTASVAVLPEVNAREVEIREEDLDWQFMRASGAGGQSVNKTNSAVRLTHKPSGIVVVSRQERKQAQNRQIALELLRSQLWQIEEEKREQQLGKARSAIGRNMRAEKIRTYNYPQSRVTDHRIKESWHNLPLILDGQLQETILALHKAVAEETIEENNETTQKVENSL